MKGSHGFTLLEVMVAVLVFGLVATAAARVAGNYITGYERIRDKTLAGWIADNEVNRFRLQDNLPEVSETSRDLSYGGADWRLETEISATSEAGMRRVEVTVGRYSADRAQSHPVLNVSAFLGNGR